MQKNIIAFGKRMLCLIALVIIMVTFILPINSYATINYEESSWYNDVKMFSDIMGVLTFPTGRIDGGVNNFEVIKAADEANQASKLKDAEDAEFRQWLTAFGTLASKIMPNSHPAIVSDGRQVFNIKKTIESEQKKVGASDGQVKTFVNQALIAMRAFTVNAYKCAESELYTGKVKERLKTYYEYMNNKYGDIGTTQTVAESAKATINAYTMAFMDNDVEDDIKFKSALKVKMGYSKAQIDKYYTTCGYNYYFTDIDNDNTTEFAKAKKDLERVWHLVINLGENQVARGNYVQKLAFEKNTIRLYLQKNASSKLEIQAWAQTDEQTKSVAIEWASMLENEEHTEWYNSNKQEIESNNATNPDTSKILRAIGVLQKQWDKDAAGATEHIQNNVTDIMTGKAEAMSGMTEEEINEKAEENLEEKKVDKDKETIFEQPTRKEAEKATDDVVTDAGAFLNEGNADDYLVTDNLKDFSQNLYGILFGIGVITAVIIGLIIGVKLMLAPVGERAEAKKLLIPYVVGCVIVFAAFGIWQLVVNIMQEV